MDDTTFRRRAHAALKATEFAALMIPEGHCSCGGEERRHDPDCGVAPLLAAGPVDLDDPMRWRITRASMVMSDAAGQISHDEWGRHLTKLVIVETVTGVEVLKVAVQSIPLKDGGVYGGAYMDLRPMSFTGSDIGRVCVPVGKLCLTAVHPEDEQRQSVWWFQGPCDIVTPWSK